MENRKKKFYGNETHRINFRCEAFRCPKTPAGRYRGFRKCEKCEYKRLLPNPIGMRDFRLTPVYYKKPSYSFRFYKGDRSYEIIEKIILNGKHPKDVISYLLTRITFPEDKSK